MSTVSFTCYDNFKAANEVLSLDEKSGHRRALKRLLKYVSTDKPIKIMRSRVRFRILTKQESVFLNLNSTLVEIQAIQVNSILAIKQQVSIFKCPISLFFQLK